METRFSARSIEELKERLAECKEGILNDDCDGVIFTIFVAPALGVTARQERGDNYYSFYTKGVICHEMEGVISVSPENNRLFGVFVCDENGRLCAIKCGKQLSAVHSFVNTHLPSAITAIQSGKPIASVLHETRETDPPSIKLVVPECLQVHAEDGQVVGFSHHDDNDVMKATAAVICQAEGCTFRYTEVMGELPGLTLRQLVIARN